MASKVPFSLTPITLVLTAFLWIAVAHALFVFLFDTHWTYHGFPWVDHLIPGWARQWTPNLCQSAWALIGVVGFLYLLWIFRATQNLVTMGAQLDYKPWQACFFALLPFGLVNQRTIAKDLLIGSRPDVDLTSTEWKALPEPPLAKHLWIWWVVLVATTCTYYFIGFAVQKFLIPDAYHPVNRFFDYIWFAVDPATAVFGLLSIKAVGAIARDQKSKREKSAIAAGLEKSNSPREYLLQAAIVVIMVIVGYQWLPFQQEAAFEQWACDTVFGANSPVAAQCARSWGNYFYRHHKYAQAQTFYLRDLEIREGTGDKKELDTSLNNLAWNYRRQTNYKEALIYFTRLAALREETLGVKDIRTSYAYSQIGHCYGWQSKWKDAEPFHSKALAIALASSSLEPGDLATAYRNLAQSVKNDEKKADLYEKALRAGETDGFGGRFELAKILNDYIGASLQLGNYKKAEALSRQLLAAYPDTGPNNWPSQTAKANLEAIHQREGRFREAEALCKELILSDEKYNQDHVAEDYIQLASLYQEEGRLKDAAAEYQRSFQLKPPLKSQTGGTVISATLLRKLLEQGDKVKVQREFPFAKEYLGRVTPNRHYAIIDMRPFIYDLRKPLDKPLIAASADKSTVIPKTDSGFVIVGETLRGCVSKIGSENAVREFPWCEKFLPGGKYPHIRQDFPDTPLPGTKLSIRDLVAAQLIIVPTPEYKKLQARCGLTDEDIRKLNSQTFVPVTDQKLQMKEKSYL